MDIDTLLPWLTGINTLLTIGVFLYTGMTSGAKKTASDLEDLKATVAESLQTVENAAAAHDKRIQQLENDFRHLPDKEIVHRLELTMKDMQIQMAGMAAAAEATARTAHRVENFLIDQAKTAAAA